MCRRRVLSAVHGTLSRVSYDYWLTGKKDPTDDMHAVPADRAVGALTTALCGRLVTTEQRRFQLDERVGLDLNQSCPACVTAVERRT